MTIESSEFQQFISIVDKKLKDGHEGHEDHEKRMLARTVKLNEEVGELCDEVLAHISMQRDDKMEKTHPDNLALELADVVLTTYLIAQEAQVDMQAALQKKMRTIEKRDTL